jgi:hypothetical protein
MGERVHAWGCAILPSSQKCLIRFITDDEKNKHRDVEMPYGHLFHPPSTDAAYEASRVMLQMIEQLKYTQIADVTRHLDQMNGIGLRLQAELYELGAHNGTGKTGLASLGRIIERSSYAAAGEDRRSYTLGEP